MAISEHSELRIRWVSQQTVRVYVPHTMSRFDTGTHSMSNLLLGVFDATLYNLACFRA